MSEHLLSANNLCCERDRRILFERLSFTLQAGGVLQIVGANGSGKTTLLRILAGLSDQYEGELFWQGQPYRRCQAERCRQMQYLGHSGGINEMLTPIENLSWYGALHGVELQRDSIMQMLERVGLRGFELNLCYALSAGQKRRVNLARLLLLPAPLWILDEPLTAIDAKGVGFIEGMMRDQLNRGGSVIVTTHQPLAGFAGLQRIELGGRRIASTH